MSTQSKIEWTEHTWNPTIGCSKVSPGCKHCYAETMAKRLQAMGAGGYSQGFALTLQGQRLQEPLRRRKPTVYFVNSMSDLFHESIPDGFLDQVFGVIQQTPQHTHQILTKRSERLLGYFRDRSVPKNVWLGISVEDREYGVPRIDDLRQVGARIRFLSVEPLLEDIGELNLSGIDWVIVGGESGPKARAMQSEWVEGVRRQAEKAGAAFFFKQWGTWGADGVRRNKKVNGRTLQGREWDEMPPLAAIA